MGKNIGLDLKIIPFGVVEAKVNADAKAADAEKTAAKKAVKKAGKK